jgi:hypothetical protein
MLSNKKRKCAKEVIMPLLFSPSDVFNEKKKDVMLDAFLQAMNTDYKQMLAEGRGKIPSRRLSPPRIKILLGDRCERMWNKATNEKKQTLEKNLGEAAKKAGWKEIKIATGEAGLSVRIFLTAP